MHALYAELQGPRHVATFQLGRHHSPFRATPPPPPPLPPSGGVYVPTLAEAIVKATKAGTYKGAPLRGIAVGNGCTGTEIGVCGGQRDEFETEFLLGTAFVQPELKDKIRSTCQLANGTAPTVNCGKLLAEMHEQVGYVRVGVQSRAKMGQNEGARKLAGLVSHPAWLVPSCFAAATWTSTTSTAAASVATESCLAPIPAFTKRPWASGA